MRDVTLTEALRLLEDQSVQIFGTPTAFGNRVTINFQ